MKDENTEKISFDYLREKKTNFKKKRKKKQPAINQFRSAIKTVLLSSDIIKSLPVYLSLSIYLYIQHHHQSIVW